MTAYLVLPGVVLLAWLLTGLLRRYALHANIVDVPGERSSHVVPTPRGAGLAIGMVLLAATLFPPAGVVLDAPLQAILAAGTFAVMVIGWWDDRRGLPAFWRGTVYLLVSALALVALGGLPVIQLGGREWELGFMGFLVGAIGMAWLINLYNFMDGTDGLAGVEAVSVAVYGVILFSHGGDPAGAWICAVLAAACAGFLIWNWPPAKVFMGDAGSCVIGFIFGALAIAGEQGGAAPILVWLILLAVFICDATLTLLRRVIARERWYSPHRTHAYQLLVQSGMSHKALAVTVAAINLFLLGPLAVFAALHPHVLLPVTVAVIAGISLLWGAIQLRAVPH